MSSMCLMSEEDERELANRPERNRTREQDRDEYFRHLEKNFGIKIPLATQIKTMPCPTDDLYQCTVPTKQNTEGMFIYQSDCPTETMKNIPTDDEHGCERTDLIEALVATYEHIEELTRIQAADGVGDLKIEHSRALASKLVDAIIAKNVDKPTE